MKKILSWLDLHIEEVFMAVMTGAIFIILFVQTILRYCFNASLNWPEEISRLIFIWYVFIGMAYCERFHTHLIVDFLTAFVPKLKKLYAWVGDITVLAFSVVMAYYGINKLQDLIKSGQLSAATEYPMWIAYLALEVGFWLSAFRAIQALIKRIIKLSKGEEAYE